MLENYACKIFIEAITSNHDLLWLITWSISWVGWQIQSLSIHGCFHKINVILVHIWSAIVCYQSTWYLYLYLYLQNLKVLVLDSSTSESTWPQPWWVVEMRCQGDELTLLCGHYQGCWWLRDARYWQSSARIFWPEEQEDLTLISASSGRDMSHCLTVWGKRKSQSGKVDFRNHFGKKNLTCEILYEHLIRYGL